MKNLQQADYTNLADLRATADIVEETTDNVTYLGFCKPGTVATNEPNFSILKIEQSGVVQPITTTFKWADGLCLFNKQWSAKLTYDYKFKIF